MRRGRGIAVVLLVALWASAGSAVPPFEVPFDDRPPRLHRAPAVVRTAALGAPDERLGRFGAARRSARFAAEARARAALHAWVDDALAAARACPWEADRVHAAVEEAATVVGVRPLVDGGAVVLVDVPVAALVEAAAPEGVPWAR